MMNHIKNVAAAIFLLFMVWGCSQSPESVEVLKEKGETAIAKEKTISSHNLNFNPPSVTHNKQISVQGKANPGSKVRINNEEQIINETGEFTAVLDLKEGINWIPVRMTTAGSRYAGSVMIEYQPISVPPMLKADIKKIYYGRRVLIKGNTDPGNSVKVNNIPVALQEDGEFLAEVFLAQGSHLITIQAQNKEKFTSTMQRDIRVIYPVKKPSLVVTLPEKPGYISGEKIKVQGFTDIYNIVEIYNNFFDSKGTETLSLVASATVDTRGLYTAEIYLNPGRNRLLIRAMDPSGAVTEEMREIYAKK